MYLGKNRLMIGFIKKLLFLLCLVITFLLNFNIVYAFSVSIDGEEIELAVKEEDKEEFFEVYNYFINNKRTDIDYHTYDTIDQGNTLYFTFDDGPGDDSTDRILNTLDKYNIKCTFFVCDTHYLDKVSRIYKNGHRIGLHTTTHKFSLIYQDELTYLKNIKNIDEKVYEKVGIRPSLIRFPGGSNSVNAQNLCPGIMNRLIKIMKHFGFQYVDWNIDPQDSTSATNDRNMIYYNYFYQLNRNYNTKIVLFHDVVQATSYILDSIIEKSIELGYDFRVINKNTKLVTFR